MYKTLFNNDLSTKFIEVKFLYGWFNNAESNFNFFKKLNTYYIWSLRSKYKYIAFLDLIDTITFWTNQKLRNKTKLAS